MEFSIDFGNVGAPRATNAPRLASVEGVAMALGQNEFVFRARDSGAQHLVDRVAMQALDLAREFRTLDEHAALIARQVPATRGDTAKVRVLLQALAQRGLMIADEAWLGVLHAASARTVAPAGPIVIRACDRPVQLAALFATLLDNEREHGKHHRYVVLDDSRDAGACAKHEALCAAFARESGADARYLGARQWQMICARLQARLPAHARALTRTLAPVGEGATHFGGGRGYCRAALIGAGARYVMLDDDFLLPLRQTQAASRALELPGTGDQPVSFHADIDAALQAGEPIAGDPFERHLSWCGHALGAVLAREETWRARREDLPGANLQALRHLRADARIAATANGHRGSSGTASSDWLLLLPPHEREALWRDAAHYAAQRDGGHLWFGAARPRVVPRGQFTPFMIDGAQLVPPAPPAGRGEDLVFGQLLAALDPASVTLLAPCTIGHRQQAARERAAALDHADTPGFNHFLSDWLTPRIATLRARTPEARLLALASGLDDFAQASEGDCLEACADYLNYRRADLVERLREVQAEAPQAPAHWRADVERAIAVNRKALAEPGPPRLADWPAPIAPAELADQVRARAAHYAELMRAWPEAWALARDAGEAFADG